MLLHKFVDANTTMTNSTNVRYPWLMGFKTDWFVWDFHDRQNVSLHQSIRASGLTAQFHYEWGVHLTFHLQYVMRVTRKTRFKNQSSSQKLSSPMLLLRCQETKQRGDNRKWFHRLFPLTYNRSWHAAMHARCGAKKTSAKLYSYTELSNLTWAHISTLKNFNCRHIRVPEPAEEAFTSFT